MFEIDRNVVRGAKTVYGAAVAKDVRSGERLSSAIELNRPHDPVFLRDD